MVRERSKVQVGVVVPHSHWDRAWYLPFQAYRLRLLEMFDDVLRWLEDGTLPLFVLDGQTVLLEDVFALRPELKGRLTALVKDGKIKIGPWYTMPDLFLSRPESLIRNLQRGIAMADELGGSSHVGYVPDSFGHFAQLPQILAGLGIKQFLFMRGMPERLRDSQDAVFQWRAPNGSSVVAIFLREGYFPLGALGQESFHGRYDGLPANMSAAEDRLKQTMERLRPVQKHDVFVLPAGGDHLPARSDLANVVDHLNARDAQLRLEFGSFETFFDRLLEASGLPSESEFKNTLTVHEGDLLGQADHPLLRNVLSSRVDLKTLNHEVQSLLMGVVEPLLAWSRLHGLDCVHPTVLRCAWDALLKNHAHDDICGCSVDEVHLDDVQRFHEIRDLCKEVITRQLEHGAAAVWGVWPQQRSSKVVVFNPHPWPVVQNVVAHVLLPDEGGEFSEPSPAKKLKVTTAAGKPVEHAHLQSDCKAIRSRYLETTWGRSHQIGFMANLPALSLQVYQVEESDELLQIPEPVFHAWTDYPSSLLQDLRICWDADVGDGYSFAPVPEIPSRRADCVAITCSSADPSVYRLTYALNAPRFIDRQALAQGLWNACQGPEQVMTIELEARRVAGVSPLEQCESAQAECWQLSMSYSNCFSDARIRIEHRLPEQPKRIVADTQARRQEHSPHPEPVELWDGPLAVPRYPGEKPYPVHHVNDGIVSVMPRGLSFIAGAGLHEFEIVKTSDNTTTIALTLQRSVGSLSVRGGRIRSCQAGPQRATPDAQLLKQLQFRLALGSNPDHDVEQSFRRMKEILEPVWVQESPVVPVGSSKQVCDFQQPLVDVADLPLQLMSCRPNESRDAIVLRLLNPTNAAVAGTVRIHTRILSATPVELDELAQADKSASPLSGGQLRVSLNPYEIKTWKLTLC